jgi:hypothetical protein
MNCSSKPQARHAHGILERYREGSVTMTGGGWISRSVMALPLLPAGGGPRDGSRVPDRGAPVPG